MQAKGTLSTRLQGFRGTLGLALGLDAGVALELNLKFNNFKVVSTTTNIFAVNDKATLSFYSYTRTFH